MIYRFRIETFSRRDEEGTEERLRELGLDAWAMVTVLPGTREDPGDANHFTVFFSRDATDDIGL